MPSEGIVFEIKEFAVFDGPGIRTTVFFKGCPLHCQWCHNPEGLSRQRELMVSKNGCTQCGHCAAVCRYPEHCVLCGACVTACPRCLRKVCGVRYTAAELSSLLRKDEAYLWAQGGGVTFSGGEPTLQGEFLLEVLERLHGMHRAIETCGACEPALFAQVLAQVELVLMDLKLIDAQKHQKYIGADNRQILQNLEQLKASGKPFVLRVPLIPGVNDDAENLEATARLLLNAPALQTVELLPYHKTAGAKYNMVGRVYAPQFDTERFPKTDTSAFARYHIPCTVL